MAQPLSGLGLTLAKEKHEQKDDEMYQLLVAQPQLDCQCQHGISPVYAGSAANWFRVGYLLHAVAWRGSRLTANGHERRLCLLKIIRLCKLSLFAIHRMAGREPRCTSEFLNFRTLSRVVARQLGLLAQVRYPTRYFVRVTILKHDFWPKTS